MFRSLKTGLIAVALTASALTMSVGIGAPANAALGDNNIVTRAEFRHVRPASHYDKPLTGMTIYRVHEIFDTAGRLDYRGGGYMNRAYHATHGMWVAAGYQMAEGQWRLMWKTLQRTDPASCNDC